MMTRGQARRSGLVMGFDTHMIAGGRACSTLPPTHPTIVNQSNPHFAEALPIAPRQPDPSGNRCGDITVGLWPRCGHHPYRRVHGEAAFRAVDVVEAGRPG
jgi:hypothetical protein